MAHIVLSWELGMGNGHMHGLNGVARPMLEQGHKITFVAKSVETARRHYPEPEVTVLPSPIGNSPRPPLPGAVNFAEVLRMVGYLTPAGIEALLRSWVNLFELLKPDLMVTDHSPTAQLAARLLDIPYFLMGTGFSIPPSSDPMPCFSPPDNPLTQRGQDNEQSVLANINQVLNKMDADPLAYLGQLFADTDRHFLKTLPELDHYGPRPNIRYWGAPEHISQNPEPDWPKQGKHRGFVYLSPNYPLNKTMLDGLAHEDFATLVVAPDMSENEAGQRSNASIRFIRQAVNIHSVATQADAMVNFGNHALVQDLLLQGKASIMLPQHTEQSVLASMIAKQNLGFLVNGKSADQLGVAMAASLKHTNIHARVQDFAQRYSSMSPAKVNETILKHVMAGLEGSPIPPIS